MRTLLDPILSWLLFIAGFVLMLLAGWVCRHASAYLAERTHASRVGRLMDVLASQADGIAGLLAAHPPAPGSTLQVVRDAAIAQGVAYVKTNLPDTLRALGVPDGVLAARLGNEVAGKLLGAPAGAGLVESGVTATAPQPAAMPSA